ncbi:hypothetical protein B7494_g7913 [Chlorociboria aeruginascens]|nr:hypothetical protein B7494_g7913 [Chlorociboria aeruginascens]
MEASLMRSNLESAPHIVPDLEPDAKRSDSCSLHLRVEPIFDFLHSRVRLDNVGVLRSKASRSVLVVFFTHPGNLDNISSSLSWPSIFLETVDPNSDFAELKQATDSQKCIRAGSKHKDLDDVGKDSYHHTFFEMLGNWSSGDYFKEAIKYSWELLTKVYGLDPDRLYVTYFEGYVPSGLGLDKEARELWRDVGVPDDHILPGDIKDNFWEMETKDHAGPASSFTTTELGVEMPLIWSTRTILTRLQELVIIQEFGADDVDGIDIAYRVVADHGMAMLYAESCDAARDTAESISTLKSARSSLRLCPRLSSNSGISFQKFERRNRGEAMFNKYAPSYQSKGSKNLPGPYVWRLYDTRGGKKNVSDLVTFDVHDIAALEKMDDILKTDDAEKYQRGVINATIKALFHSKKFIENTSEIREGE